MHLQARYNSIANLRSVHLLLQDPRVAYPPLRDSHSPRATLLPRPLDTTRHLPPRPLHIPSPKTRRLVKRLACSSFSSAESASGISATASQTRLLTGPSRHQPSPRPSDETHSLPFAKQPPLATSSLTIAIPPSRNSPHIPASPSTLRARTPIQPLPAVVPSQTHTRRQTWTAKDTPARSSSSRSWARAPTLR